MDTIADLIEAAKMRTGKSYTEISERLERSKQLITNWKSGKKVPTDGDVLALARMAGENADKWLAIAAAARTEGEAKVRWERIAQRLAMTACLALCAIGISYNTAVARSETGAGAPAMSIMSNARGAIRYYLQVLLIVLGGIIRRRVQGLSCST